MNNDQERYMIFLPSSKMVKGARRTAICDLQRNKMHLVPNDVYDFVQRHNKQSLLEIRKSYQEDEQDIVSEYLQFLEDREYIFYGSLHDTKIIDEINEDYHHPSEISHALIEYSSTTAHQLENISIQLSELGCVAVQIISYTETMSLERVSQYSNFIETHTNITSVEFILPYTSELNEDTLRSLTKRFLRIDKIILHNSRNENIITLENGTIISYHTSPLHRTCCGIISKDYFTFNKFQFSESQSHNSCLHKKLSIDSQGSIKNCPSMKTSFGNISTLKLRDAYSDSDFKKYWNVHKGLINVCKDCEFRHVCTDCRAYLEQPNDSYSKPLKCGYDPYTNTWSPWSTNPLKKKAIDYYKLSCGTQGKNT